MVKYKIHGGFGTLINLEGEHKTVKFWFINGVPFTFDDLMDMDDVPEDPTLECQYTIDDLYQYSSYLVNEECHPLLFEMEELIENFQDIPY
tara:strand:+ start:4187 stop:4459 length:273 start_codon:yes stop_codon:yes gene_type:complete